VKKKEVPPSLKHWTCNLQGMEYLVKNLTWLDISYLLTKNINQDPVKFFFCQIRQHGGRNTNPTVVQSKSFFKTLLINNFVTRHSINANCENDDSSHIFC
jgi:hypothetical protein